MIQRAPLPPGGAAWRWPVGSTGHGGPTCDGETVTLIRVIIVVESGKYAVLAVVLGIGKCACEGSDRGTGSSLSACLLPGRLLRGQSIRGARKMILAAPVFLLDAVKENGELDKGFFCVLGLSLIRAMCVGAYI